jgi:hypothetical protein
MVGKTRLYAQIIQLTMPIAQLPIPNFIFHMALVYGRGGFTRLFVLGNYGW